MTIRIIKTVFWWCVCTKLYILKLYSSENNLCCTKKKTILCVFYHKISLKVNLEKKIRTPAQSCVYITVLAGVFEDFSEMKTKLWWMQTKPKSETISFPWHKHTPLAALHWCFNPR